jgi:hypothetical protein
VKPNKKRKKLMGPQILVALKSEDRLSQMIPYIEKIAQPGMKVVFLIGFRPLAAATTPRDNAPGLRVLEEPRLDGEAETQQFAAEISSGTPSMEKQRLSVEHKVFLALEALRKKGVEILVDVYAGSLKRVVKHYMRKGNVHFIVKRVGKVASMIQFVRRTFPILGSFNQRTSSAILLLHSTHAV